ncbi:methyl-accepting chemotaxis protein [Halomonas sp. M20]|uniref:methyl-accepting chemotaxis protein n=1 Tax=Halomonas sp. M20 TaxID=2763264 RepID=UPI001D0A095C|nr:methyl-accepting chemotaxis protein [Halomonas sp. M20]
MHSFKSSLRRLNVGTKLSLLIVVLQLVGFVGLSMFLSQAAIQQLQQEVSQSITRQQTQVADMVSLFDETLQEEVSNFLNIFLADLAPDFTLDPQQRVDVVGRDTPTLSNGEELLNGVFDLPDAFTAKTGAPVTMFARDGDDFVRVTTSLKKANGERAVGTLLNRDSHSYARLMSAESYTGIAELFGTTYITKYQPIRDSRGEVIGASFIGIDITQELAMLKSRVRGMTHDESGYTMLVNASGAKRGHVIAGGPHEEKSLAELTTPTGEPAYATMFSSTSGRIDYALAGSDTRERNTYFISYPDWNWIIASTVFPAEVQGEVVALRNWSLLAALLLALCFAGLMYFFQRRLISAPLAQVVTMGQGLAKGDLSQRYESSRQDEIGKLITSMNGIGEGLTHTVGRARASGNSVNDAAANIAQSSQDLASRTEQSAANLQETSASMEQITATIKNTAHSAQEASQLVHATADIAKQGNTAMGEAQNTMEDINTSATKISEITTLIDGIAFQTNILALNASVEAARAGEHGRGFAVVAQEVRTLATRSSDASKEIRELIDASLRHTESGAKMVKGAAQTMQDILKGIERVSDMISEISAGTKEQSEGISQINLAVTELDTITQQNASMVQQSNTAAEMMSDESRQLSELLASFKLGFEQKTTPAPLHSLLPGESPTLSTAPPKKIIESRRLAEHNDDDWSSF